MKPTSWLDNLLLVVEDKVGGRKKVKPDER